MKLNLRAILLAITSGILLVILLIHPITISLHAFDTHAEGESWFPYLMDAYGQVLSFSDIKGTLIAVFYGVMASFFVMMLVTRKKKGEAQ